jgi:PEP-CTERM motif
LILNGTTLFGMTFGGGTDGYGNIFSLGIDGSDYQDLYSFTGGIDGKLPEGDLTFSGGTLFGMTTGGGNLFLNGGYGDGTVFALALPEPGTLALAGSAAVVAVTYRWRKRRKKRR